MAFMVSNENGSRLIVCCYQSTASGDKIGRNPTDRAKLGTKRHILTDKNGIPLSAVITAANTHDAVVAIKTLDNIVIRRPIKKKQNLCLDRGYYSAEIECEVVKRRYVSHIRHRGGKKKKEVTALQLQGSAGSVNDL
jgi:IS5 family transposase